MQDLVRKFANNFRRICEHGTTVPKLRAKEDPKKASEKNKKIADEMIFDMLMK